MEDVTVMKALTQFKVMFSKQFVQAIKIIDMARRKIMMMLKEINAKTKELIAKLEADIKNNDDNNNTLNKQ